MTVTEEFECVITKDGYELYVRKVHPIRKNDTRDYKILCQMGQRPTFKQPYSSPTFSNLK